MKKLPALKRIQTLTQDQRDQIVAWLEEEKSYRWIIKQTAKPLDHGGFGQAVPKTCLWRINKRRLALKSAGLKKSIGDLSQIAKDINHYAATGEAGAGGENGQPGTGFHSATLVLIEKQALELALDQSDHGRLKDLFRMKLAHENAQTRKTYTTHRIDLEKQKIDHRKQINTERMTLENRKQDLREKQFEHGKSMDEKKLSIASTTRAAKKDSFHIDTDPEVIADKQAQVEKICMAHPVLRYVGASDEVLAQLAKEDAQNTASLNPNLNPNLNPSTPAEGSEKIRNPQSAIRNLGLPPGAVTDHLFAQLHPEYRHQTPLLGPPLPPPTLEERINEYTLARFDEALIGRNGRIVGKHAAYNFKSKMQWCPCGNDLPCPDHGDFPDSFFTSCPMDYDYFHCLDVKKMPHTGAGLLWNRRRKQQEQAEYQKYLDAKEAAKDQPAPDPEQVAKNARAYTIKRAEEYHQYLESISPLPEHLMEPPPYVTAHRHCPCGHQLPCPHHEPFHESFWSYGPLDDRYIRALKDRNLPYTKPIGYRL